MTDVTEQNKVAGAPAMEPVTIGAKADAGARKAAAGARKVAAGAGKAAAGAREAASGAVVVMRRRGGRALLLGRESLHKATTSTRASIGPRVGRLGRWLRRTAIRSLVQSRTLARGSVHQVQTRAVPATIDAGWRLRERLRPRVLKQDYRRFQIFMHRVLFDRTVENLLFASSKDRVPLNQLHIRSLTRLSGRDYRPTPRLVFEWAMEALPEPVKRFAFVDFGAGVGRVLMLASHWEFEKIIGVEFAQELHDDCLMNIAQYPRSRMKCRDVTCILEDATHFDIPDQDCVLYFFNPFGENVLREVMARVARSYDRNPRRIYVISVDLAATSTIEEWRIFERIPIERQLRLKIRTFSPYTIAVYRSIL
ncbi:MAG: class I SAM-dependent methyltransferase [Methyloligellaceae bacterium]